MVKPVRYEVWLVSLDPTKGSEIRKTRPCMIVSPDEVNRWLRTVIVAPMTSGTKNYPTRVNIDFGGVEGQVVLEQLRTLDRTRLVKRLGVANKETAQEVAEKLIEMFEF